jgi:cytochrome c5
MLVLGILVVVSIAIYVLATWIWRTAPGGAHQGRPGLPAAHRGAHPPIGQVAIAGRDNTGLRDPGGVAPAIMAADAPRDEPAADLDGEAVYKAACTACHGHGHRRRTENRRRRAWQPRIDQGMDTLVRHAIEGFQGQAGYMPPRGGNLEPDRRAGPGRRPVHGGFDLGRQHRPQARDRAAPRALVSSGLSSTRPSHSSSSAGSSSRKRLGEHSSISPKRLRRRA